MLVQRLSDIIALILGVLLLAFANLPASAQPRGYTLNEQVIHNVTDLRPESPHPSRCSCFAIFPAGPVGYPWWHISSHYDLQSAQRALDFEASQPGTCPGNCVGATQYSCPNRDRTSFAGARVRTNWGFVEWESNSVASYAPKSNGRLLGQWDGNVFYGRYAKGYGNGGTCSSHFDGTKVWGTFEFRFSPDRMSFEGSYSVCGTGSPQPWNSTANLSFANEGSCARSPTEPRPAHDSRGNIYVPPPPVDDPRFPAGDGCIFGAC